MSIRKVVIMNKEEIIDFIIESITKDYYEVGESNNMSKEQIDNIVSSSNQTIVHFAVNLYSRLKEKNLLASV